MAKKRVLIVFYSFTQQTRLLVKNFMAGLEDEGVTVALERLQPVEPYDFPFKNNMSLGWAMLQTFAQKRMELHPVNPDYLSQWDCIVIAGPTWSYNPSGPILAFLDTYGSKLCKGQLVLPFISCRSYWRIHHWIIKHKLKKVGAHVQAPIVFTHPIKEPWRIIGLMLQLRGKMMRKENSWFRKHYPSYGHSKEQVKEALGTGRAFARELKGTM